MQATQMPDAAPRRRAPRTTRPRNETIIAAMRATGGIMARAAKRLKCDRATLSVWVSADPVLQAAQIDIRESFIDDAEDQLIKQIKRGDTKSVHFLLRTVGKHRGYAERVEIAGTPGQPLEVSQTHKVDLSALSADELKQLEHILSKASAPAIDANVVDVQAIEYQPETDD